LITSAQRFLVLVALYENAVEHVVSRLNNGNRRTCWSDKPSFLKVPILCQVFTEGIGIDEYTNRGGYRILHSQLLCTTGCIVGNVSTKCVLVAYHAIERAAGANRFLLCQFLVRHSILAVQFLPRATMLMLLNVWHAEVHRVKYPPEQLRHARPALSVSEPHHEVEARATGDMPAEFRCREATASHRSHISVVMYKPI